MGACSVSVLSVLKKGESQTSHFPFAVLDATLPAGGTGIGFDERRPCLTKSYVLPFVAYLVGVNAISWVGASYPISYAIVVLLVTLLSWHVLRGTGLIQPHWNVGQAVLVGLSGFVLWIGLCELGWEAKLADYLPVWLRPEPRVAFNLFTELTEPWSRWGFFAIRLFGLVAIVPLAEELFWRGFLLRWLTTPDWEQLPLGRFNAKSFLIVVLAFTLAHPEWIAAAAYCTLLNWFLYRTKDLWSCMVAHAVTNLVLAIYVVMTGTWRLW